VASLYLHQLDVSRLQFEHLLVKKFPAIVTRKSDERLEIRKYKHPDRADFQLIAVSSARPQKLARPIWRDWNCPLKITELLLTLSDESLR
jgi:hypothetical protein